MARRLVCVMFLLATCASARGQVVEVVGEVAKFAGDFLVKKLLVDEIWNDVSGKTGKAEEIENRLRELEANVAYRDELRAEVRKLRENLDERITRDEFRRKVEEATTRFASIERQLDEIRRNDARQDMKIKDLAEKTNKSGAAFYYILEAGDRRSAGQPYKALANCGVARELLKPEEKSYLELILREEAESYLQLGSPGLAGVKATEWLEIKPGDARALLIRGKAFALQKRFSEAAEDFTGVLAETNDGLVQTEARERRIEAYLALGDFDRALADCDAFPDDRKYTDHWNLRAKAHLGKKNYDQAIADASKAIDKNATKADYFCTRAEAQRRKGSPDPFVGFGFGRKSDPDANPVVVDCGRALIEDRKCWLAHLIRGRFELDRGDLKKAIESFEQAIELNPNATEAHLGRVRAFLMEKPQAHTFEQTIEAATQAVRADPASASGFRVRAEVYLQRAAGTPILAFEAPATQAARRSERNGYLEKGLDDVARAIRLEPKEPENYALRANLYLVRDEPGDQERFKADYETAGRLKGER